MFFWNKRRGVDAELAKYADHLNRLLTDAARSNKMAALVLEDLRPYIKSAISGKLEVPVARVPRRHDFVEGELKDIPGLETAYAKFSLKAEGYDMEIANKFMDEVEKEMEEENKQKSLLQVVEDIRLKVIPVDHIYSPFLRSDLFVLIHVLNDGRGDKISTDNFVFHMVRIEKMDLVVVSEEIELLDGFGDGLKAIGMTGEKLVTLISDELGVSIVLPSGGTFNLPPKLVAAIKVKH